MSDAPGSPRGPARSGVRCPLFSPEVLGPDHAQESPMNLQEPRAVYSLGTQRMKQPVWQHLISGLLLAAFCLGQTLIGVVAVRCTDSTGQTRIEVLCNRTDQGECQSTTLATACSTDADLDHPEMSDSPDPCRDEPLGQVVCRAKLIPQPVSLEPALTTLVVVLPWLPPVQWAPPAPWLRPGQAGHERPPDSIARLSTIVLVV